MLAKRAWVSPSLPTKCGACQVATAIRNITAEAAKVQTLVDEVSLGSQEQSRGIEQIGKAVHPDGTSYAESSRQR